MVRGWSGKGFLPAWTIATVLAMAVTTIGVSEIASRVTAPLSLDAREGDDPAQPLVLAAREAPAAPVADVRRGPVAAPAPELSNTRDARDDTPAPDVTAMAEPRGEWVIDTEPNSTTRWARGPDNAEGGRTHHLEYLEANGTWTDGYANLANTSLTTPWIEVPTAEGRLEVAIWSAMHIEHGLDGYLLSWSSDGEAWTPVERISGGEANPPVRLRTHGLDVGGSDRIMLRMHFRSDYGGSKQDEAVRVDGEKFFAEGASLDIRRIALRRTTASVVAPEVGTRWTTPPPSAVDEAHVVVAVGGPSINPYHREFRDTSPRAFTHPSTYVEGYPAEATAVWLSLDAPTLEEAFLRDRAIWESLRPDTLYWFPGTRIIGAVAPSGLTDNHWGCFYATCILPSFDCGVLAPECDAAELANPWHPSRWYDGRGTGLASLAVGETVGTCPDCLLVHVDALWDPAVQWPAEHATWIDVQVQYQVPENTRSSFEDPVGCTDARLGTNVERGCDSRIHAIAAGATERQLVVTNPGQHSDGAVQHMSLAGAPGVVTVAGHDRGHVADVRSGSHVAVDFCRQTLAAPNAMEGTAEVGANLAWATPTAGGTYASVLLEARRLAGDLGHGSRGGAMVVGTVPALREGPLADGRLEMHEWRDVVENTATPRPPADPEGPACTDGEARNETEKDLLGWHYPSSAPVAWQDVPAEVGAHRAIGYGGLDAASRARASAVLRGELATPDRPEVDAWFELEAQLREAAFLARRAAYGD